MTNEDLETIFAAEQDIMVVWLDPDQTPPSLYI